MKKINQLQNKEDYKTMCRGIEELHNLEFLTSEIIEELKAIEEEGYYCVLTEEVFNAIPFEERWYVKYELTYYMSVLLLNYYNEGHNEVEEQLCRTMKACLTKKYFGHGYDQVNTQLAYLILLYQNGLNGFLDNHIEFKNDFDEMNKYYRERYAEGKFQEGFGSIQEKMEELFMEIDEDLMFTYGTLMKNQRNHYYLEGAEFVGEARINNYGLLEIGSYPGAIPAVGKSVLGEVYKVDGETKRSIDCLEGSQYQYKNTIVIMNGKAFSVHFYEFVEMSQYYSLSYLDGKWQHITNEEYVWYAGYGSNLCYQRFMAYINRTTSKQFPLATKRILFSHPIYFAKHSSRWKNAGVAFLDIDSQGSSYGVMYLITRKQLEEIQKMEGKLWYNKMLTISKDELGIDIVTLTHDSRYDDVCPSKEYFEIIGNGIKNVYHLDDVELNDYLHTSYLNMDYSNENILGILEDK